MIDIFDTRPLDLEDVDVTKWWTEDGEEVELEDLEEEELMNLVSNLHRRLKMQPEHYNSEIWEAYVEVCFTICEQRGLSVSKWKQIG